MRSKRIFTEDLNMLCHCLSKNFFKQIPAFQQKNVRCTVERTHGTVNKNFTFLEVSIWQKFVRCKVRGIIKTLFGFSESEKNLQKVYIRIPDHQPKFCPFRVRGVTQNLNAVIYPTERIYRKFTSDTLIFSEKMYVVI